MTYDAQETSTEEGQPVEFYLFSQKLGTDTFTYTSGTESIVYLGKTYLPVAISRTEPKLSPKSTSGSMTLTLPKDNAFVVRYLGPFPPLPDKLTIYRTHSTDLASEVITFWEGDVKAVSFDGDKAKIALSTLSERLAGAIPKRVFSYTCNHVLYDSLCQVGNSAHKSEVDVVSIDASNPHILTVQDHTGTSFPTVSDRTTAAGDLTYFDGGYVDFLFTGSGGGTHSRSIVSYVDSTNTLTLSHRISDLNVGGKLSLFAGCDHDVTTCQSKFNNVNNYGGFPFVPGKNPFSTGVIDEEDTC